MCSMSMQPSFKKRASTMACFRRGSSVFDLLSSCEVSPGLNNTSKLSTDTRGHTAHATGHKGLSLHLFLDCPRQSLEHCLIFMAGPTLRQVLHDGYGSPGGR